MDLAELLQIALLALAFGCGIPALAYLAFKGNLREQNSRKEEKKQAPPSQPQFPEFPESPFTAMKKEESEAKPEAGWLVKVPGMGEVFIPMKPKPQVHIKQTLDSSPTLLPTPVIEPYSPTAEGEGAAKPPVKKQSQTEAELKTLLELEDEERISRAYHKVAVRGYLYIPKPVLREAISEAEAERRKLSITEPTIGETMKPAEPKPPRDYKLEVRREG